MRKPTRAKLSETLPLWERPEPANRPAPSPLSRRKIVRAAIGLADKKGLSAVSLRNVGAALKAGPMRLYGYVATKDELLDLMVDAVYGEIIDEGPISPEWRDVLKTAARRLWEASLNHPWFIDLVGGRPRLGPNALAHFEATLSALGAAGVKDIDAALSAFDTLTAYAIGAIQAEKGSLLAEAQSGMTREAWQDAWWPYLERLIATGGHPILERIVREANHPSAAEMFERGLDCVIDGIESRLLRTRSGSASRP